MPNSSTRANDGSNASNSKNIATSGNTVGDQGPSSYSVNRFLSNVDRNHPPGYEQAQSSAESKTRMQEVIRNFDAKFYTSGGPLQRNDSPSHS